MSHSDPVTYYMRCRSSKPGVTLLTIGPGGPSGPGAPGRPCSPCNNICTLFKPHLSRTPFALNSVGSFCKLDKLNFVSICAIQTVLYYVLWYNSDAERVRNTILTTAPGIPLRPSEPGLPGDPWGPTGPVFPGGPSNPDSPFHTENIWFELICWLFCFYT